MAKPSIVDPKFAAVLRTLVQNSGLTQADIAARAFMAPGYLSELINGRKVPGPEKLRTLDTVLGADGVLAAFVSPAVGDEEHRRFAEAVRMGGRINSHGVESFAAVLAAQRTSDDLLGSATVAAPVRQQLEVLSTKLVPYARGPVRVELLSAAGQWAQFYGWLMISTGRLREAGDWLRIALQWAVEANDHDLIATVLSYLAHSAWFAGELGSVTGLAAAALRDPDVYPGQRAYDAFQHARATAAAGEVAETDRMLEVARDLAEESNTFTGPLPAWQYYRDRWLWLLEEGIALRYLARHDRVRIGDAVAKLRDGVAAVPEAMRSADWFAEYLLHLVSALIEAGELDDAAVELERACGIAEAAGSQRVLALAERRRRRLAEAGHGGLVVVRDNVRRLRPT